MTVTLPSNGSVPMSSSLMDSAVLTLFPQSNLQAAENAETLLASPLKGFLVGGASAGGNLAAAMTLRARDDAFFTTRPLTGQLLQYPVVCHPDAYPERYISAGCLFLCAAEADFHNERYKSELLSIEQNKDAPVIGRREVYWCISAYQMFLSVYSICNIFI